MVHSEVYPSKYVVSIAPLSPSHIHKTALFYMFSLFNFSSIFPGGQLTPFAPMYGRPCKQPISLQSTQRIDVAILAELDLTAEKSSNSRRKRNRATGVCYAQK